MKYLMDTIVLNFTNISKILPFLCDSSTLPNWVCLREIWTIKDCYRNLINILEDLFEANTILGLVYPNSLVPIQIS